VTAPPAIIPAYDPPSPAAAAALAALLASGPWWTPTGRQVEADAVELAYAQVCRRIRRADTVPQRVAIRVLAAAGLIVRGCVPGHPSAWITSADPRPTAPVAPAPPPRRVPRLCRAPDPVPGCTIPAKPSAVARFWHRAGLDAQGIAAELAKACPRDGRPWTAAEAAALLGGLAVIDVRKRLPAGCKLS
jgi:hypothetical protein